MNSKTLSIYATIMAVVLVTGVASISASSVYAEPPIFSEGEGDEVELKNKMVNEDCEEALCVNAALNIAFHDLIIGPPLE